MNDLISRKALIEECEKKRIVVHTTDDPFEVIREQGRIFRKAVEEAPTVDAVEVVRCKDCVYSSTKRSKRYNQLLRFCEWGDGYEKVNSNGSFFCAHGKRSNYGVD